MTDVFIGQVVEVVRPHRADGQLVVTENGSESTLQGIGTTVSRRHPDGTGKIVLDNPLTAT